MELHVVPVLLAGHTSISTWYENVYFLLFYFPFSVCIVVMLEYVCDIHMTKPLYKHKINKK